MAALAFYDLGLAPWWQTQCVYHALAELGRTALVVCRPREPYVCLGVHDDLEQEVDREFCGAAGLPLLRRETGGGVVYLDDHQVFYQLVLRRDDPLLPGRRTRFFQRFLRPAVAVYERLGVPARIRPPADLDAGGRKCSGNAAGDIGAGAAFVGNVMLDFDRVTMSRVLRLPDDAFRRTYLEAMERHLTAMAEWRADPVDPATVAGLLAAEFEREFGGDLGALDHRDPDSALLAAAAEARGRLTSPQWLAAPGRRSARRRVKVAEGVYVDECGEMERDETRREEMTA